jgi:hypothetical protein
MVVLDGILHTYTYLSLFKISHIVAEPWWFICGTRLWDGTKEMAE